jgi:hypothetical protein
MLRAVVAELCRGKCHRGKMWLAALLLASQGGGKYCPWLKWYLVQAIYCIILHATIMFTTDNNP